MLVKGKFSIHKIEKYIIFSFFHHSALQYLENTCKNARFIVDKQKYWIFNKCLLEIWS